MRATVCTVWDNAVQAIPTPWAMARQFEHNILYMVWMTNFPLLVVVRFIRLG